MTASQWMNSLAKVDLEGEGCLCAVYIYRPEGEEAARMAYSSTDNLPLGTASIKMNAIAASVIQLLETRSGMSADKMNRFIETLADVYKTRMESEAERVVDTAQQIIKKGYII